MGRQIKCWVLCHDKDICCNVDYFNGILALLILTTRWLL